MNELVVVVNDNHVFVHVNEHQMILFLQKITAFIGSNDLSGKS